MRIQEVQANSAFLKAASLFSKWKFGKILAPLRTIYALQPALLGVATKMASTEKKLSLNKEYCQLIKTFVSTLNNCPFCSDINFYLASKMDIETRKLKDLLNYKNNDAFSPKEKAMLAYCEEVSFTKTCTDECFNELKKYFTDKEIVEITWLNAQENYFNLQAKPLGLSSDSLLDKEN